MLQHGRHGERSKSVADAHADTHAYSNTHAYPNTKTHGHTDADAYAWINACNK
jgi:hypothetical protein